MFLCRIARCRANVAIRIDAETNLQERGNETLLYVAGNKNLYEVLITQRQLNLIENVHVFHTSYNLT